MLVALIAIAIGLAAGAVAPMLAYGLLSAILPLPIAARVEWLPLADRRRAGLAGDLCLRLWPLAHTRRVPASALFRAPHRAIHGWPSLAELLAIAAALAGIGLIVFFSFEERRITGYFLGGLVASFVLLLGLARLIIVAAQRMPRIRSAIWRYAIGNIYRPGSAAASVILALGLGLTLFVTLALTDRSISQELQSGLPEKAPAFFFLDVRNAELADFKAAIAKEAGVTDVNNAPMLRGRMVSVKGVPAEKVEASPDSAWALRGDRGLTYSETLPEGLDAHRRRHGGRPITTARRWSRSSTRSRSGIGVKIGDEITVNVLGRDITAKVANLRQVNWRSLGINFVMVFSPNTLKSAPHSHIVTVEMEGGDEADLLNKMARAYPSVTAVRVKDALDHRERPAGTRC